MVKLGEQCGERRQVVTAREIRKGRGEKAEGCILAECTRARVRVYPVYIVKSLVQFLGNPRNYFGKMEISVPRTLLPFIT